MPEKDVTLICRTCSSAILLKAKKGNQAMKKTKKLLVVLMTLAFVFTAAFSSTSMVFASEPTVRLVHTVIWEDNNNADGVRPERCSIIVVDQDGSEGRTSYEYFDYEVPQEGENFIWQSDENRGSVHIIYADGRVEWGDAPESFPKYQSDGTPYEYNINSYFVNGVRDGYALNGGPGGYVGYDHGIDNDYDEVLYSSEKYKREGSVPISVEIPVGRTVSYNGADQTCVKGYLPGFIMHGTIAASEPGAYTATAHLLKGFIWSDGTTEPKTIKWEIKESAAKPIEVVAPIGRTHLYNGRSQTGVAAGEGYTLSGTTSATNAGTYSATATLAEGYIWSDGTTDSKPIEWKINKAEAKVAVPIGKTFTYNGKTQTGVAAGSNYTLSGTVKATKVGTFTAKATLKTNANYIYKWSDGTTAAKTIKWTINKAANPLTIKAKTATVKGSTKGKNGKLKKTKTLAVSKVIAFTKKGQGKLTYTKASGNKKITINKTTGKVTVKKGLKKGTYKVKVKVKAAGNTNYKASAVKTVTFKVKVK